ncbi:FAD-binding oxidoreductase [Rhodovastum atsumiense]|uniref:FAD-binding oxidoreductase n=1 Tax=Rhodovastum atsumiense TaxID=504468 RepID=A0A5M6INZ9_9PROT|nr:FAD-dependent oxidoreductase [Rhodovastum atsumiense]KAA5609971.1 FAD-binding oxidoreductase [Rhodovastum atsumiense]CAH2598611.1 FAD-binding oxidoreductase [Rhodovastum atsumiense]
MSLTADAVVVGGGLHGCSAALHLARRGRRVILLEKESAGRHASGVNAGGVRRLLRVLPEVPLSCASMRIWHHIADLVGEDCGFQVSGQVAVAETEAGLARLRDRAAEMAAHGYTHEELIGPEELYALLPALAPGCLGGLVSREDGFASPYHTTMAFRAAAIRAGATVLEGTRATGFRRVAGRWQVASTAGPVEAAVLLNCGGAWGAEVAAALGETVPLEPIAPMMMVTAPLPPFVEPVVIGVERKLSFKQMPNRTVMIGGGYRGIPYLDRETSSVDFRKLHESAATVASLFPVMRDAVVVRSWSGIESRLPDDMPVIGPSSTEEGAFHAFGFSAHGFQLGPIVGQLLAELVETGTASLPIAPFSVRRFAAFGDSAGMTPSNQEIL